MEHTAPVFDLDTSLIQFTDRTGVSRFTIRDAVQGVQIFGGIGSGKTSGSGRTLALKYLAAGFGGLVLTVKPDEAALWQSYCQQTGRADDLLMVKPGSAQTFSFLNYESKAEGGISYTDNILQVLKTVIRASEEKSGGKSDDPFWENALDQLIYNTIDLCRLAYGTLTIDMLYDAVTTVPTRSTPPTAPGTPENEKPFFERTYNIIKNRINAAIEERKKTLSKEMLVALAKPDVRDAWTMDTIPDAALFRFLKAFFLDNYKTLNEKTRSIVEFSFTGFLFRLLKEPVRSLFCNTTSTFTPEDCSNGKIIVLDLPVKLYHKVGRDAQLMFKYIWQRAMEKRKVTDRTRPVFLWADEAQHFLHEYDADYQATARSSRIATVYLSQNLPNYHANMGGVKYEFRVKSFLGTLGTKMFHANADIETNTYASSLIGEAYTEDVTRQMTVAGDFQASKGTAYKLERMVRPEEFVGLRSGGPQNTYLVDAYMHIQGKPFPSGMNHRKVTFSQT